MKPALMIRLIYLLALAALFGCARSEDDSVKVFMHKCLEDLFSSTKISVTSNWGETGEFSGEISDKDLLSLTEQQIRSLLVSKEAAWTEDYKGPLGQVLISINGNGVQFRLYFAIRGNVDRIPEGQREELFREPIGRFVASAVGISLSKIKDDGKDRDYVYYYNLSSEVGVKFTGAMEAILNRSKEMAPP